MRSRKTAISNKTTGEIPLAVNVTINCGGRSRPRYNQNICGGSTEWDGKGAVKQWAESLLNVTYDTSTSPKVGITPTPVGQNLYKVHASISDDVTCNFTVHITAKTEAHYRPRFAYADTTFWQKYGMLLFGCGLGALFFICSVGLFGVWWIRRQRRLKAAKDANSNYTVDVEELQLDISSTVLGSGTQSIVYRAIDLKTGSSFAVKQFTSDEGARRELEMLQRVSNPHVVTLYGAVKSPKDDSLLLVMEVMAGGSLASIIPTHGLGLQLVSKYTEQILKGAAALHECGIIHRDIKTNNILVDSIGVCKIADMGFAIRNMQASASTVSTRRALHTWNTTASGFVGTLRFSPPELLHSNTFSTAGDVWMIGMVALTMSTGVLPWQELDTAPDIFNALDKIAEVHPDINGLGDATFASFLSRTLCKEPESRWTCEQLLQHPFITDKDELYAKSLQPLSPSIASNAPTTQQGKDSDGFISPSALPDLWNSQSVDDALVGKIREFNTSN
eukprot:TRINITY_DN67495_c5_g1_i2.p1 TRINITY_DN67495_c5_g1~~TRINITY_DN67495_c5_g1_i2.p1  ORF type:complete len:504 (+),score=38.13 TRINITY_DN67495_c5_g1_i2:201-1712(+)